MADVKFNLKERKAGQDTLIYLIYRYDGKRFKYSTGEKIKPEFWNYAKQRVGENHPQAFELNTALDNLENETKNIYRRFKNDGKIPSPQELRNEMDVKTLRASDTQQLPKTLFSFFEYLIKERAKLPDFEKRTIDYYRVILGILRSYAKAKNRSLDFADITLEFYNDFLDYLYNDRQFSTNYAGNIIKGLKIVLNQASEQGVNANFAYKGKYFKKPAQETDNIYLTLPELAKIYHFDFFDDSKLERVRDLFIIGCFTGLRFSDFSQLKPENIKTIYDGDGNPVEVFSLTTRKTNEKVVIPLHPFVSAILRKYDGKVPRALSNQKMNEYLKDVAKKVGLTGTVQLTKSKGGKSIRLSSEKWELVTTHAARRSFATNAYKSGVPSISIMKITGHRTEKAFLGYIKITSEENAVLVSQSRFFKGENILKAIS